MFRLSGLARRVHSVPCLVLGSGGHRTNVIHTPRVERSMHRCHADVDSMVPSFMTWIERCNSGLACQDDATMYTPFCVDGHVVGYVDTTCVLFRFLDDCTFNSIINIFECV